MRTFLLITGLVQVSRLSLATLSRSSQVSYNHFGKYHSPQFGISIDGATLRSSISLVRTPYHAQYKAN